MRQKIIRVLFFLSGLILIGVSFHGAFLIKFWLRLSYPWRINMTLDDYPLYLGLALPLFAFWMIVVLAALGLSRRVSGNWLWPFSPSPGTELRRLRPMIFVLLAVFLLVPLKNRGLDDVFILGLQVPAFILLFFATRGFAEGSLAALRRAGQIILGIRPGLFFTVLFLLGGLVPALFNVAVLGRMPHLVDEIDYLFQAKIFAGWRLTAEVPALGEFFHDKFIIQSDYGWYSQYPAGWPAVLMLGYILKAPWLVNPLLGGMITALVYTLGKIFAEERCARLAGILALLSPYLWLMNAGMMSHTSCAFFLLIFLIASLKVRESKTAWLSVLAGACLGIAATIRPYSAVLFSVPVALLFLKDLVQRRPLSLLRPLILVIALFPFIGFLLFYNLKTTGHPLLFGYKFLHGELQNIGFGMRLNVHPYTPLEAVRSSFYQINVLCRTLFLWPAPALIPALALFILHRPSRKDWFLLSIFVSLLCGYFFYYFTGDIYAPRFIFEAAPALLVLTARGIISMWEKQDQFVNTDFYPAFLPKPYLAHLGLIAVLVALILNFPYETGSYRRLEGMGPELKQVVKEARVEDAVIFIDPFLYGMGLELIDPKNLEKGNIYARDLGARDTELLALYPDRRAYRAVWNMDETRFILEPIEAGAGQ